jgi:3-dehydroquinate dehydratase I
MQRPRICAAIVENDPEVVKSFEPLVDLFEVRLDLVGPSWPELVKGLKKPWIACNRSQEEGGNGHPNETRRLTELVRAVEAGASVADIELNSKSLDKFVPLIKAGARCLVSFHDTSGTPSFESLVKTVKDEIKAGADICKVVTSARSFSDNLPLLKLIRYFPGTDIVAFAMGEAGKISRVLSPLAGGYFTYACLTEGKESAAGQVPVQELSEIYDYLL